MEIDALMREREDRLGLRDLALEKESEREDEINALEQERQELELRLFEMEERVIEAQQERERYQALAQLAQNDADRLEDEIIVRINAMENEEENNDEGFVEVDEDLDDLSDEENAD
ncbi:Oidioi.mRNA.OKI2018_I69.chr2.g5613.t1.cds [Oikopleura dioica]|uniref:Oidioi.mRNA.OKI2018_I69.XSR.g15468.t1.cds n=1 Tax=Oikopleura dioica TaxID=34765 RepID=A0ABN7T563_OIKDI|nr:Oidioi.mRNA.OKI2018_I69.XSR.g15468.t1.cds [Oikopleura dioica]CAG5111292.1 Oidioi.mRNA.OKI2018_I69.chr2.g5613.t1.cds [Oikopleura dioica]